MKRWSARRQGLAAAAILAVVVAPAAAQELEPAGTQPGDLENPDSFVDADSCGLCHGGGFKGDKTFLPTDTWAGTMMGNAARDPVFFAALAVANQDEPGSGTFCLRCHSPVGFVRGHATPPDGSAFDAVDAQGVGCETCHRAVTAPEPFGPYAVGNARLHYDDDTSKRGPYDDAVSPAHSSVQALSLGDSRFCGQCHQVTNPGRKLRDAGGVETAHEFPLDTTYEEWEESDFSRPESGSEASCVDCHMRRKQGAFPVVSLFGAPERPSPRDHALVGGNLFGIEAVMAKHPDRAALYKDAFDLAKKRTLEMIADAATVTLLDAPQELAPGETFDVTIRVENESGHKFPTGYAESRRAWIAVELVDDEGHRRALLGGYDDATGHIQAEPPTHVYRAVHGRWNGTSGEPEEHLVLHDMLLSDTRIPPRGFVPSIRTMPSPEVDFSDGLGGYRSHDEATFTLTVPLDVTGKQELSARVYYQSMTREYVEFLRDQNTTDSTGNELFAIYESAGKAQPLLVGSDAVPYDFGGEGGAGGAGGGGGAGGAGGSGEGGEPGAGGDGGEAGRPPGPPPEEGCGCRAAGAPRDARLAFTPSLLAAFALLAAARRRPAGGRPIRR